MRLQLRDAVMDVVGRSTFALCPAPRNRMSRVVQNGGLGDLH